ncbi:arylamine N-acetyltransferase family protein [Streptomyces sp. NPDC003860]
MAKDHTLLDFQAAAADPIDAQWGTHLLDVDAYLARVGHPGPRSPSTAALFALHRAHKETVSFENVDVALGREVSLELPDVQRKLVTAGRGGYCFEHNLLFAGALERLGLSVTRLLARVRQGRSTVRYRAHTTLLVIADGELFLSDVGFGAEGLLEPLPLVDGATSTVGGFRWQVVREDDQWVLRTLRSDGWFDLYSFRLERHHSVDFDVSNYYTAHHPRSTFTGKLVAMRGDAESQQTLTNSTLRTRHADGRMDLAQLSGEEAVRALRETFAIRLEEPDALRLEQLLSTTFRSRQEA